MISFSLNIHEKKAAGCCRLNLLDIASKFNCWLKNPSGIGYRNLDEFQILFMFVIYANAERLRLTRRPKASIWLVNHHLRSLNTVNKGHNKKNMPICRCFEFPLLGRSKHTRALRRLISNLFIRRLLEAETLLHFVYVVCLGFKSILVL